MDEKHSIYREQTWAPLWVFAILWTACLAGAVAAAYDLYQMVPGADGVTGSGSVAGAAVTMGIVLLFPALITALFTRLDVEVRSDHVLVAFGPVHLVRKRIPFVDIESVRGLTYRPIREFGGWGIRPRGSRTAWTVRGNQAVKVTLQNGKEVYVGSRFPQRLEERIRTAMRAAGREPGPE